MFVDRPSTLEFVDGKVTTQDMGRFDVFFDERDIKNLADPDIAYTTDRFMGCTDIDANLGWMPEDKVHIRLEEVRHEEDNAKVVELHLDQGGDLYFTIWNSTALAQYVPVEFEAKRPFLTADPSDKLATVGIRSFCLHQLLDLSHELAGRAKALQ